MGDFLNTLLASSGLALCCTCGGIVGVLGAYGGTLADLLSSPRADKAPWVIAVVLLGPVTIPLYWLMGRDR